MNVRLVCAFASSSCIGTEPAAYVEENVESENTDFRAVVPSQAKKIRLYFIRAQEEQELFLSKI